MNTIDRKCSGNPNVFSLIVSSSFQKVIKVLNNLRNYLIRDPIFIVTVPYKGPKMRLLRKKYYTQSCKLIFLMGEWVYGNIIRNQQQEKKYNFQINAVVVIK